MFLQTFLHWLEIWKSCNLKTGCLTVDTRNALYHCTAVLIESVNNALSHLDTDYVLLGKLQTENLEGCFSCYHQLSGGNYNISVPQILDPEKKMRVRSLLGVHSAKYGQVKFVMMFLMSALLTR